MAGSWFQPEQADPDAELRLFMFPFAGGNTSMYHDWADLLPDDVAMQAVQLPGRADRYDEPPFTEMAPLVDAMREAFLSELDDRPYAVFGHSMGAMLAYRLAVALDKDGQGPALLGSAGWAPEGFATPTREQVELPQDELVRWVVSLGSVPAQLYQNPEVLALTMQPTRADLRICMDYQDDGSPISCPVATYSAGSDPLMDSTAMNSWRPRCTRFLGNCEFPGGHFFIYHEALNIATDLVRHLRRCAGDSH